MELNRPIKLMVITRINGAIILLRTGDGAHLVGQRCLRFRTFRRTMMNDSSFIFDPNVAGRWNRVPQHGSTFSWFLQGMEFSGSRAMFQIGGSYVPKIYLRGSHLSWVNMTKLSPKSGHKNKT